MHALVRSHANPAVSVLAVSAEVRTISCGGVVHAVAAGDGGVHAKIVALAGRLGAGPVPMGVPYRTSDTYKCRNEWL